jgi:hypothetical protein
MSWRAFQQLVKDLEQPGGERELNVDTFQVMEVNALKPRNAAENG